MIEPSHKAEKTVQLTEDSVTITGCFEDYELESLLHIVQSHKDKQRVVRGRADVHRRLIGLWPLAFILSLVSLLFAFSYVTRPRQPQPHRQVNISLAIDHETKDKG